jgi:hypothetical protein
MLSEVRVASDLRGREFESRRPRHSSQGVIGRDTNPQSHPQLLLNASPFESHGVQKLSLNYASERQRA